MYHDGYAIMNNPRYNKGLEFNEKERDMYNLRGLLPVAILTPEKQLEKEIIQFRRLKSTLDQYIFMQSLQDRNEKLYYRMLIKFTTELMPIVYTPTVGQACLEFSHIYRQTPRGLYISLKDTGKIDLILNNWPEKDIRAIVFTDGERILGLGDLGVNGMGIPIGKLALYTACAGVHPKYCLPITIDVGTNNEELLKDPFYMGLRQKRINGPEYDAFIEEFIMATTKKYGKEILLQFEDFGNTNAFRLLHKYQSNYCTFNDDIQGTAAVVVAGLLSAIPLSEKPLSEHIFLFLGAGEAGTGIADLIALAITQETNESVFNNNNTITLEEARKKIFLVDSKGLITSERLKTNNLQHHKKLYAHYLNIPDNIKISNLEEAIDYLKPSVLIGVCTIPKSFNIKICNKMALYNKRPIIFALSNPTSKAECTAEEAYEWTNGKCIFASGSPFSPFYYNNQHIVPGQGNNAYIFPGLGLGIIATKMKTIPNEVMLIAAEALAKNVQKEDLNLGCVYPPLSKIRSVSLDIAIYVAEYGFLNGLATIEKPSDLRAYISSMVYEP